VQERGRASVDVRLPFLVFVMMAAATVAAQAHDAEHGGITVVAGGGADTAALQAFFPERVTVGVGDTVTWQLRGDDIHIITFTGGEPLPEILAPVPGAEPGEVMFNPRLAFPSRPPGEPVETCGARSMSTRASCRSTRQHLAPRPMTPSP
jgi:plastocyanin